MSRYDQDPTWQGSRPDDGNTFPATPGQSWGGDSQTRPGQPQYPPQQPYPPQYPSYPGGGYQAPGSVPPPGGQYPGAPYPGQGYPAWGPPGGGPPPSGRRGLPWWGWVLIAVGGVIVLCVACSFVGYAVTHSPSFKAAFATAEATFSPQATATTGVGVGDHMRLGTNYVKSGLGFAIVNPQDHFAASDQFDAVIDLGRPFNTTSVKLLLVRVDAIGTETIVDSADRTIDNPNYSELLFTYPTTGSLMSNHPAGTYKFEVSVNNTVVAQATFTYTG
jgi:hypothetical protein